MTDFRKTPLYFDSELDDLGLDPYAFRLYMHLVRRAGGGKHTRGYETMKDMAKACRMNEQQVGQALATIVERGLVEGKKKPGAPATYHLLDKSEWVQQ